MPNFAPLRLCALALLFSNACAQPPDAELQLAANRVEIARSADAAVFAAEPLHAAETALATARKLMEEKGYLAAVHAAGDAVTQADTAVEVATLEKKITIRRVDRCLRELEGLMAIARSRGAAEAALTELSGRYTAVKATAESGDLLAALEQGQQLKPELLELERRFRD